MNNSNEEVELRQEKIEYEKNRKKTDRDFYIMLGFVVVTFVFNVFLQFI